MTYPPPPPEQQGFPAQHWQPVPQQQPPSGQSPWLFVGFGVVVVALIIGMVWAGVAFLNDGEDDAKAAERDAEPTAEVTDGGFAVSQGGPRVDIYLDFACPACRAFHEDHGDAIEAAVSDDKATVVLHPLTFLDGKSSTGYSSRAASAAVCAADADQLYPYHAALLDNQPDEGGEGLDNKKLAQLGTELGLDDAFAQCVTEETYRGWAKSASDASGVTSTPTVRLDGREVASADFAEEFSQAIGQ